MTGKQALERGVRDAVDFGPTLILNGTPLEVKGFGGGLNPRTAIGQRADGAILLLVLDGRQPDSLGATMGDIIDLMLRYKAVNAANLDGGTSTVMYYHGELLNFCCSLYGPRDIPTAVIIKDVEA
jgi:exopolysaccharide biosynthesis protein